MVDSEKWKKFDKVETLIWFREMAGISACQSPWSGLEPRQCESSLNSSQRKVMLLNYKHETWKIFHHRRQPSQYLPWVMIGQAQSNSLFKLKMWTQLKILALAGAFHIDTSWIWPAARSSKEREMISFLFKPPAVRGLETLGTYYNAVI